MTFKKNRHNQFSHLHLIQRTTAQINEFINMICAVLVRLLCLTDITLSHWTHPSGLWTHVLERVWIASDSSNRMSSHVHVINKAWNTRNSSAKYKSKINAWEVMLDYDDFDSREKCLEYEYLFARAMYVSCAIEKENYLKLTVHLGVIYFSMFLFICSATWCAVPQSPVSSKILRSDPSGVRQRIKANIKTIAENHRKWEAAQRRGVSLCTSIDNIKSHAIKSSGQSIVPGEPKPTLYPNELKSVCEKLRIICTIFEDVLESAKESRKQIDAAIQLGAANIFAEQTTALNTWPCERIVKCLNDIIDCYEHEYCIKIKCMQNIAHSRTKAELVLHSCAWEFPTYVTAGVQLWITEMVVDGNIELESKWCSWRGIPILRIQRVYESSQRKILLHIAFLFLFLPLWSIFEYK